MAILKLQFYFPIITAPLHFPSLNNNVRYILYQCIVSILFAHSTDIIYLCLSLRFSFLFYPLQSGEKLYNNVQDHSKAINDIQMYKDGTMFVTASKDTTAKVKCSKIFYSQTMKTAMA